GYEPRALNLQTLSLADRLPEDEFHELGGEQIGDAKEGTRCHHESDHDGGGLDPLAAIGPLYSLQLSPASLQEVHEPREDAGPVGRGVRPGRGHRTGTVGLGAVLARPPGARLGLIDLVLELLELLLVQRLR